MSQNAPLRLSPDKPGNVWGFETPPEDWMNELEAR